MDQDKLSLKDKALVFLYLLEKGLPPWLEGQPEHVRQQRIFARLFDVSEDEAEAAFIECLSDGHA